MSLPSPIAELIEESYTLERSGDIAAALGRAREALDLARSSEKPGEVAAALVGVARFRFRLGQYQTAQTLAEEALTLAAPDAPARVDALLMLGMCAAETESLSEAEGYYQRAADLAREIGHHLLHFRALHNLGTTVYLPRGQFDLSLAASQEALRLARECGLDEWLSYPLLTLAWVYQFTGQRQRAREALAELSQVECVAAVTRGYLPSVSALLALDEGNLEAAPPLFAQARSVAESTGDQGLGVDVRIGLSRYHRLSGNAAAARDWADDALSIARRIGYHHSQGQALIERGRAAWLLGECAAAEDDLRAAVAILSPLQANFDLARAELLLASLLHSQRRQQARQAWQDAARQIINGGYAFLLEQERALAFPLVAASLGDADPEMAGMSATLLEQLDRVPPSPLRIVTLGRLEVWQGTHLVETRILRQRRADDLLGLLLVTPRRSLSRDQIAEALWPDQDPATAQTRFHHATSALRQALEPDLPAKFPSRYLVIETGWVTLRLPPNSTVDFEIFEQHAQHGRWADAVSLYGGDLFPQALYADWAVVPRESLAQRYLHALFQLAQEQWAASQPQQALKHCQRILAREPWHEQAVLLGMRACMALNDRAGALRLYRNLASKLEHELGTAPQEELQVLYQSLLKRKPSRSSS